MNHLGTKIITTDRLILRPFLRSDIEDAFSNWCSDYQVTRYLRWSPHSSMKVTEEVLMGWVSNYNNSTFYQWAIEYKENCQVIGTIAVTEMKEQLASVDIGYCIGRKWWNKGITSEAFTAIIGFLFESVGVNRIQAQHDPHNISSGKVMNKCGLTFEGTLRQADYNNQGIVDACTYSILREEYMLK